MRSTGFLRRKNSIYDALTMSFTATPKSCTQLYPLLGIAVKDMWEGVVDGIFTTKEARASHFCLFVLANALRRPIILHSDAKEWARNKLTRKLEGVGQLNEQGCCGRW